LALPACERATPGQATAPAILRKAVREGEVVVYSNHAMAGPVVAGFERRFPGVKVRYRELTASLIQTAVLAEAAPGRAKADVAWSSSMDIQVKLINDGYAQTYRSPEARRLPRRAIWRDQGFGVTAEPIGFAYNRRLLKPEEVPRSHAELLRALRADPARWRGKIALYDPEKSGVGFMYLSADTQVYPEAWTLMNEIGHSRPGLYVPGGAILGRLSSGEHLLAFNMNRSYADWWTEKRDGDIAYLTPSDYHFTISRVAFITRTAPHPNAARLFLDYLMSDEGQQKLREGRLTPIRDATTVAQAAGAMPIRVGPALLANLDQGRRARVLKQWRGALEPAAP
jgi:iron(III) transport system substrate-binding protein